MRARVADADGRVDQAVRGYATALAAAPDNVTIALRAYREALDAGDYGLADRAMAALAKANALPEDAALLSIGQAAAMREPAAIDAAIAGLNRGALALIAPSLRGWAALDRGADPIAAMGARPGEAVARRFYDENHALLHIARRGPAGLDELRALLVADQASLDLRIAAAQLLIGQGRADVARTLLTGANPVLTALRNDPIGESPSFAFGASRLFTRIAGDLSGGTPGPLSITLARAALRAEPTNGRARLLLADALARGGAPARALAVLDQVPADDPFAAQARNGRIRIQADAGDRVAALAGARALAAAPGANAADQQRLGDLLLAAGLNAEAAGAYAQVLERDRGDWSAWLQYGGALDVAGRWSEAEPALARAVALAPDEPLALNYLAYARITHGEPLAPALAMLEKASRLKPDDPSITDSLGWAYHLDGESAKALPLIERAAAGSPDNAEIGEHLGDIYWSVGRRYEARYAWRAAQVTADAADAQRLAGKIVHGLPVRR